MELLIGGASFLIGILLLYIIIRPKLKKQNQLNKDIDNQNQELYQTLLKYKEECKQIEYDKERKQLELESFKERCREFEEMARKLENQATASADKIYEEKLKVVEERLKNKEQFFKVEEENYKQEYLSVLEDLTEECQKSIIQQQIDLKNNQDLLTELQSKVAAAVEANKRAELDRTQKDFYRLQLPEIDIKEIAQLRSVIPYLRNPEALNKVIWKVYYEKPYTDLIGRVIGNRPKTGIYKITNLNNNMCYVGQAANVAERWKQHIKRGIGAETPTRNKLYPIMRSVGVENFTFELIEECDRVQLDAREDYWQDYFKAIEYGYSIK